ncbi:MAG: hypothetical protein WCO62_01630 [Betaproteobacteria bacterium]
MQVRPVSAASIATAASPKPMTAAQALAAWKINSRLKVSIADTAENISANLKDLNAVQTQIVQVNVTNMPAKVNLTSPQAKTYVNLLAKFPENTLVLNDTFDALNSNISSLRVLNPQINKMVITPSTGTAKQMISPWDSQLWSKSVNGKFEVQTHIESSGSATNPSTTTSTTVTVVPGGSSKFVGYDDTQALAINYRGLKALDDMGMLTGIESFKGTAINATVAESKALTDLFNKYSTEFYLNIRDTSSNISKNIDFISNSNKKIASITQIGNIKPLQITQAQNFKADKALSKMKNAYSLLFTG